MSCVPNYLREKGFPGANILRKRGSKIEMRAMVGNLGHFGSDGRTITL